MTAQNQDFNSILNVIHNKFNKEIEKLGSKNHRGTLRHKLETEFCYLLREVADDCPTYNIHVHVGQLLTFCTHVKDEVKKHFSKK